MKKLIFYSVVFSNNSFSAAATSNRPFPNKSISFQQSTCLTMALAQLDAISAYFQSGMSFCLHAFGGSGVSGGLAQCNQSVTQLRDLLIDAMYANFNQCITNGGGGGGGDVQIYSTAP
jgi:hypothetical protein